LEVTASSPKPTIPPWTYKTPLRVILRFGRRARKVLGLNKGEETDVKEDLGDHRGEQPPLVEHFLGRQIRSSGTKGEMKRSNRKQENLCLFSACYGTLCYSGGRKKTKQKYLTETWARTEDCSLALCDAQLIVFCS